MRSAMTEQTPPRTRGPRAAAGFTILETVIALFITLMVGLGAVSLFVFSVNFNSGAADRARALALAQQRLEAMRAQEYTHASLAVGDTTETVQLGSASAGQSDLRAFKVRTQIEYDAAVSNDRQKIITVTVTPAEAARRWTGGAVVLKLLRSSNAVGDL